MDIPIPRCKFPRQASISDTDSVVLLRQALKFLKFDSDHGSDNVQRLQVLPESAAVSKVPPVGETRGLLLAAGGISRPAVTKAQ